MRPFRIGVLSLLLVIASLSIDAQPTHAADSAVPAGIEALRKADIAATVSSNESQLLDLWSDDGVLLGQGDPPHVGKVAIKQWLDENFAKHLQVQVLKFEPSFESLEVHGDIAYEWGHFLAIQKDSAAAPPVTFHGRFLRVMRRQADGKWKFTRVMWQAEKP